MAEDTKKILQTQLWNIANTLRGKMGADEFRDYIVGTYRKRARITKFSHCADRSEVEENDYNLNIPRYVDTFDEEEKIDLTAVSAKLTALEGGMTATNKELTGFCKELGIALPY